MKGRREWKEVEIKWRKRKGEMKGWSYFLNHSVHVKVYKKVEETKYVNVIIVYVEIELGG